MDVLVLAENLPPETFRSCLFVELCCCDARNLSFMSFVELCCCDERKTSVVI